MLEPRIQQHFFESADLLYQVAENLSSPLADAAQAAVNAIRARQVRNTRAVFRKLSFKRHIHALSRLSTVRRHLGLSGPTDAHGLYGRQADPHLRTGNRPRRPRDC